MLPSDPADIDLDIEEMVVDALERLPEPFRDQLGSVAIVIEEEASPTNSPPSARTACTGSTRAFRGLSVRGRRPDPEQDHDLPRAARAGEPDPRGAREARR